MIVGNVGSPRRASVGGGGALTVGRPGEPGPDGLDGPPGLVVEWWIGADDRWHRPAAEITTRMSLADASPIVRTATRVPGGDAAGTWWAVRQGRRELAVLDVQNRSGTPFALAVVVHGADVHDVTVDGETVRVGGAPVLFLPRSPQFVASVPRGGDLLGLLSSPGGAVAPPAGGASFPGECEVAVLLPVAHMVHARVAVLLGVDDVAQLGGRPVLRELPSPEAAAKGWDAVTRAHAALALPGAPGERFEGARRALLLWPDVLAATASSPPAPASFTATAAVAVALARSGAAAAAVPLADAIAAEQGLRGGFGGGDEAPAVAVQAVAALSAVARFGGDAARFAPVIAGGLEFLRKRAAGAGHAVFAAAAPALRAAGEDRAADAAIAVWRKQRAPWPVPAPACPPVPALSSGGELVPDDPCRLAREVAALLDVAVREAPAADGSNGIALLAGFDDAWRGAGIEVHRVPTDAGLLSFAVRWHGPRAALLWEIEPVAARAAAPLRLTCPVLAPAWSTTEPRGETLL